MLNVMTFLAVHTAHPQYVRSNWSLL